jgi:hypothetical protein
MTKVVVVVLLLLLKLTMTMMILMTTTTIVMISQRLIPAHDASPGRRPRCGWRHRPCPCPSPHCRSPRHRTCGRRGGGMKIHGVRILPVMRFTIGRAKRRRQR